MYMYIYHPIQIRFFIFQPSAKYLAMQFFVSILKNRFKKTIKKKKPDTVYTKMEKKIYGSFSIVLLLCKVLNSGRSLRAILSSIL